jgi:hypothetical protein
MLVKNMTKSSVVPNLRRRDFLALGSLAVLAPLGPWSTRAAAAMPGAGAMPGDAEGDAAQTSPAIQRMPLSLGYLEGSDELENLRKLPRDLSLLTVTRRGQTFLAARHVVPANELPAGDPSLVGGAVRMTVHDTYPSLLPNDPAAASAWPTALDLDVTFPLIGAPRGGGPVYKAWSYRRLPAEDRSARVSFLLWPDWYSDLILSLRVVPADEAAKPRLMQAAFTLGNDQGRPRLLKGAYLLGLTPEAWNEPADLPDNPSEVPIELLSVLVTVEPEGVRVGGRRNR